MAENIIEATGSSSKIVFGEPRKGDIQDSYADITLAKNLLGYNPATNLSEGLKKTMEWYKEKKI